MRRIDKKMFFANGAHAKELSNYDQYDILASRLKAAQCYGSAIKVGQIMPPFVLPDENGSLVGMLELISGGPLLITFNNGHWCSYCREVLLDMREHYLQIKASGVGIVAISSMSSRSALKLVNQYKLPFPILTDSHDGYAMFVGLAVCAEKPTIASSIAKSKGENEQTHRERSIISAPATYVVDSRGVVIGCHISSDFRKRMPAQNIIPFINRL